MKKYVILGVAFFSLAITSCTKSYLDINQNPNSPTEASISADLILPNSQVRMGTLLGATSTYRPLNHWMGQWVRGGDFGINNQEERYELPTTFGQGLWNGLYDILQDVNTMEKKATAAGQNFYIAAAKVLKVEGFRQLVDMFNNVPYSKAFDLGGNILPAYDKGSDIYVDLFKQLDDALVAFGLAESAPGQSLRTSEADVMFNGNIIKWRQYINTLRLKLVLRLSQTTGIITVSDQMAKITSEGYIPAGGSAQIQPGYIVTAGKLNPFWSFYKADENGIEADKFNRANPYVLNLLVSNNDIRYTYYFSPAKTPVANQPYRAGEPYGAQPGTTASDAQSNVAGKGLAKSATGAQWVLTSVESFFLQAEARARGYITSGPTAQSLFENGIRESFSFLGVTNGLVEANLLIGSAPAYTYPVAGTLQAQIKAIIEQKYFSLVGMSALDIYSDYRRTGYPVVPLSLNATRLANIPVRYPYPQNEYNFNAANVIAEGTINPITTFVFWDN